MQTPEKKYYYGSESGGANLIKVDFISLADLKLFFIFNVILHILHFFFHRSILFNLIINCLTTMYSW